MISAQLTKLNPIQSPIRPMTKHLKNNWNKCCSNLPPMLATKLIIGVSTCLLYSVANGVLIKTSSFIKFCEA